MRDFRCDVCGKRTEERDLHEMVRYLHPVRRGRQYDRDPNQPAIDACRDCREKHTEPLWLDYANAGYDALVAASHRRHAWESPAVVGEGGSW